MAEKRDRMIGTGRFTVAQIAKAVGAKEAAIEKYIQRKRKGFGHPGHSIVRTSSHSIEGAGPECPESPDDVPLTPAGVKAELRRMLTRQKEMEKALKNDGPAAMPALLTIMAQQRSTIETMLKAEVVFANMPSIGPQDTPQTRAAEVEAYFSKLIEGAPQEVRDWILRRMTGEAPELRHCETETPGDSGEAPKNNGNRRNSEAP